MLLAVNLDVGQRDRTMWNRIYHKEASKQMPHDF